MIKLIICAALISTFFVTAYCEESASSSESESWDEGDDGKNEPTCPEYEVYSKCPAVKCDAEYCPRSRDDPLTCPIGIVCDKPRCVCMNNRHRDRKTKKCILTQNCPPFKCDGKNEEYNSCPAECPSEKCSDYVSNKTCGPPLGTHIGIVVPCKPQCRCKKGYYRNDNVCVKAKDCPCTEGCGGDPNAVKTNCGSYCGHSCSDYDKADVILCAAVCNKSGCSCKKNYVYDPSVKKCVKPEDCTPTCPENEVYSTCTQGQCGPKNCTQLGQSISCPRIDPKYCKKGCLCAEGYLRNENGKCIPKDQCPSSEGCDGDPNAVKTDCGSYCRHSCSDYDKTDVICPDICNPNGCSCKKNYVYDPKVKKCVKPKECTSSEGCDGDPNAVKTDCGSYCGHSCSDYDKTDVICPDVCNQNGCSCKKNYVYDPNVKKCVKPKECTQTCPKNEVYSTCTQGGCGPKNCTQLGEPIVCPKIDPKYCKKGCVCAEGYLRNDKGKCIPKDKCPSSEGCDGDPNAVKTDCGSYCGHSCSDYDKTDVICTKNCNPNGCSCKKSYVYDPNVKKCVKPKECTQTCPKNEVYSTCTQGGCGPKNCTQLGEPIACPKIDPKYCKKGCVCAEGYLRNEKGKCIPKDKCPSSEGCDGDPNAVRSDCGSYCGHSCSDYNKTGVVCPLVCRTDTCSCKKNYVYDPNEKKCVKPAECTPTCGENEVYSTCTQGQCGPKTCSQLGKPIACPKIDSKYCKKGCLCAEGYLRNEKDKCIPKDKCPSSEGCDGDPNAVKTDCGSYCGHSCSDYDKTNVICTKNCNSNGCSCKKSYVYDPNVKKCVKPKECKKGCGGDPNAVSDCAGYCGRKCTTYKWTAEQRRIGCPHACIDGCNCKDGYLYDEKVKKCVRLEDCSNYGSGSSSEED